MKLRDMKGILATAILLLLTIAGAWAQTNEGTYRLKPEDILKIQVFEHPEITAEQVPVGRDGNISAPFVGTVKAEGKTTADLEAELTKLYEDKLRIREPKVSVVVLAYRVLRATIGGQVNRPGVVIFRPGDTILTLLNQGGGPLQTQTPLGGAGDLRRALFRRAGQQEVIPVDLHAMQLGDMSQNYTLEDGDELIIPEERNNRVSIQGMVQRPGVYPYKEPMTVQDAISLAGGEVPRRTRFSKTMVFRQKPGGLPGEMYRIQVNYVRYIRNGDVSQNIELKPGDLVWVPETDTPDLNYISGVVNSLFFFDRFFREGVFGFRPFR
jgi:protein involved in polysaccharide export with SLBB domain